MCCGYNNNVINLTYATAVKYADVKIIFQKLLLLKKNNKINRLYNSVCVLNQCCYKILNTSQLY